MTDLSICIVNHETPQLTANCVDSVLANAGGLNIEILVLNNTHAPLPPMSTEIRHIQNDRPQGFASNQNKLLGMSRGRYVMALNSDIVVHSGALSRLVQFMDATPQCGLAGPKLLYPDGRLQPSMRQFPAFWITFLDVSGLWLLGRGSRLAGRALALCHPHDETMEAAWLSGACLTFSRVCLDRTGAFDATAFGGMYGEDADLGWRIAQKGFKSFFVHDSEMTHFENASPMPDRAAAMARGLRTFLSLHYPAIRSKFVLAGAWLGSVLRFALARNRAERDLFGSLVKAYS